MSGASQNNATSERGWRRRRPLALWRLPWWTAVRLGALVIVAGTSLAPGELRAQPTIAVAAPLTGPQASDGAAIKTAAEWAIDAINAEGGIAGERVELITVDDQCLPTRAAAVAAELASGNKPSVVVGHPCAASAITAARIYAGAGMLYIATAPRHPDLTARRAGKTIFRLAGRDDGQGTATGRYLAAAYAGRRIAIVHDRTNYARGLVDQVKAALSAAGQPPPPEFGIVASEKDYSATVAAVAAVNAAVIYFAGFPTEAATLASQFKGSAATADFLGADAIADAAVQRAQILPARGTDPPRFQVVLPHTSLDAAGAERLSARLTGAGLKPSPASVATYAAIEAWAAAARTPAAEHGPSPNTPMSLTIARRLTEAPAPTIVGPIVFDAIGDARVPSFAVAHYADGRWTMDAVVSPTPAGGGTVVPSAEPIARSQDQAPQTIESPAGDQPRPARWGIKPPPLPVANPRRASVAGPIRRGP